MSIEIFTKEEQAFGQFNGGGILENKPLGFPQDGGRLKPFSNLFYWAHAWTPGEKSLIGEHPHQGFEILSFVLKGSIEHYDSKNKDWQTLKAGDVQIIRAGSGITHAEMVNEQSSFFQIWFDPNLNISMTREASYSNHEAKEFQEDLMTKGVVRKKFRSTGAPIDMLTPGVEIYELKYESGSYSIPLKKGKVRLMYCIEGEGVVNDNKINLDDFIIQKNETNTILTSKENSRVFVIDVDETPDYMTYASQWS